MNLQTYNSKRKTRSKLGEYNQSFWFHLFWMIQIYCETLINIIFETINASRLLFKSNLVFSRISRIPWKSLKNPWCWIICLSLKLKKIPWKHKHRPCLELWGFSRSRKFKPWKFLNTLILENPWNSRMRTRILEFQSLSCKH